MTMTFGSLFAGIGGLDLGLERAGMACEWQVEIDDYATRVLERHWPDVRRWRNVTTFPPDADNWIKRWTVDLICGGFPCQDISYAGRGAGLAGERSGLFFEVIRVVRQLRPRYVLLENVAALLTRGLDRVLGELGAIGYDAEWHCIPAASVGAPHIRDRAFVLAYANDAGSRASRGRAHGVWATPEDSEQSESQFESGRFRKGTDTIGARLERRAIIGSNARSQLAAAERSNREPGGQWSVEPDVGRVAHGVPARVDRLRGLGNAVVPQVGEYIGRLIQGEI